MCAEFSLDNDRYFFGLSLLKRRVQMKTIGDDLRPLRRSCLQWVKVSNSFCRAALHIKVDTMPRNFNGVFLRWLDLPQACAPAKDSPFNAPAAPA